MKIFLDVGGHLGGTLLEVIHPRYGFDKIYSFEPAPNCWSAIEAIADPRIELCRFGLWNRTCQKELYGAGGLGASIFADSEPVQGSSDGVTIELVRATDWLASHVRPTDVVFMKLNCEGSECDVVEDLLDSHLLEGLYNVMIDFDVRSIPSLRWREGVVRRRLRVARLTNVCFTEDVMIGTTHEERIRNWLCSVGGEDALPLDELRHRHANALKRLSARRGYAMRVETLLRRELLSRLPGPLQTVAKRVWRASPWARSRV
jgi:FkbM family methyltransferase